MKNKKTEAEVLLHEIIKVLKKGTEGCDIIRWAGTDNGNGEEYGTELDEIIIKIKKYFNHEK